MNDVNRIINESGLSKVSIARYLGVSRQMLYNYLALKNVSDLPKDKYNKLLMLFGVENEEELKKVKIDDNYIQLLEKKTNEAIFDSVNKDIMNDLKGLNKKEQELITNIFNILKDRLVDNKKEEEYKTLNYLYYYLQTMEQVEELKYILAYTAKANGFINPLEFIYDEEKQYNFEGILYSAMTLYGSKTASKVKIAESHKKFEKEISDKNEDKLSRTQELNYFKTQALNELGYTTINESNAKEVFEKIAEIMSRKF